MLLAIDVGNTHTVYGIYQDGQWKGAWRRATNLDETEDQLASWVYGLCQMAGLPFEIKAAMVSSVVPGMNTAIDLFCKDWLGIAPKFLHPEDDLGLPILYEPKASVGADRIANALAALEKFEKPIVIVDFGTATTVEAISEKGEYLGGAIMPGVIVASQALFGRAAKVPIIDLREPDHAIGRNTTDALRAGTLLGYAGAVDTLVRRFADELGATPSTVATGGLAGIFMQLCESIQAHEPNMTLEGLLIAARRYGLPVN